MTTVVNTSYLKQQKGLFNGLACFFISFGSRISFVENIVLNILGQGTLFTFLLEESPWQNVLKFRPVALL
jgi:hypothetical protein